MVLSVCMAFSFNSKQEVYAAQSLVSGTFEMEDGNIKKYLIQKINTTVFAEPYKLMKNIDGVTTYLKRQLVKEEDETHQVLEIVKTKDNKPPSDKCFLSLRILLLTSLKLLSK